MMEGSFESVFTMTHVRGGAQAFKECCTYIHETRSVVDLSRCKCQSETWRRLGSAPATSSSEQLHRCIYHKEIASTELVLITPVMRLFTMKPYVDLGQLTALRSTSGGSPAEMDDRRSRTRKQVSHTGRTGGACRGRCRSRQGDGGLISGQR